MGAMLKSLIGSKKAAAAVAGVLMAIFGKKVGLDEQAVTSIIATVIAYLVGQGIADHGKGQAEAYAKQNAASAGQLADTSRVPTSGNSGSVGL